LTLPKIKLNVLAEDDASFYRSLSVSIRGVDLTTPVKAVNLARVDPELRINASPIGEVYRALDREDVESLVVDVARQSMLRRELAWKLGKADRLGLPAVVLFFALKAPKISETALTFLLGLQYELTRSRPSFFALPNIERVGVLLERKELSFEDYKSFIDKALRCLEETLPNVSLLVPIPLSLPPIFIEDLVRSYLRRGVDAFYLDFEGRTWRGLSVNLVWLHQTLRREGSVALLYAINLGPGMPLRKEAVIPALDLLSLGVGVDILGDNHLPPRVPADVLAEMGGLRLLNKEDYGYYKPLNVRELSAIYPSDSLVPLDRLLSSHQVIRKRAQSLFNAEQAYLEMRKVQGLLREGESVVGYLKEKKYVITYLEEVLGVKKRSRSFTIADFL